MLSFGVTTADHSSPFPLLLQQHTPCISSLISFIMNLLFALFYPGLVAPCSAPLRNIPATLLIPSRPSLPPNRPTNAAPLILILNSVIPHHSTKTASSSVLPSLVPSLCHHQRLLTILQHISRFRLFYSVCTLFVTLTTIHCVE